MLLFIVVIWFVQRYLPYIGLGGYSKCSYHFRACDRGWLKAKGVDLLSFAFSLDAIKLLHI